MRHINGVVVSSKLAVCMLDERLRVWCARGALQHLVSGLRRLKQARTRAAPANS